MAEQYQILPFLQLREWDNNGLLLAGGTIEFLEAGSLEIRQDTYKDALGAALNENPVVLNDAGTASIFIQNKKYHCIIRDADGVVLLDVDGIGFEGSGIGDGTFQIVANYDALRNLPKDYSLIYVMGRSTTGDGGEGFFEQIVGSTEGDEDGILLVRQATTRYKRLLTDIVDPRWYGVAYGVNSDNSVYLATAIDASARYHLPLFVSGYIAISKNVKFIEGSSLKTSSYLSGFWSIGSTSAELRFSEGSKILEIGKLAFVTGLNVVFEKSVCEAIHTSWFYGSSAIDALTMATSSTGYNYKLLVDSDMGFANPVSIKIPKNFAVDFIGGSRFNISALVNVDIENLIYTGTGQIINYKTLANIGTVSLGDGFVYLEWFGGLTSTSNNTDNSIAFQAALKHGRIHLISNKGEYYSVKDGAYTGGSVVISGNYVPNNNTSSDSVPSTIVFSSGSIVTVDDVTLKGIKIAGAGSITGKITTIQDTIIADMVSQTLTITSEDINDVIQFEGVDVAVGGSGKIVYSIDNGKTWTLSSLVTTETITSIAKNQKYLVAVGSNGKIWTSPNGIVWTARTTGVTQLLSAVEYLNGQFIAVGDNGRVLYSVDGETWNIAAFAGSQRLQSITLFGSLFVAVGFGGSIQTSTDLLSWTDRTMSTVNQLLYSVDCTDTLIVATGTNGTVLTSTDAITWRFRFAGVTNTLTSVRYYPVDKIWLAIGTNGAMIKSPDGIIWTAISNGLTDNLLDQSYSNGEYLFVSGTGAVYTSFDLNQFTKNLTNNTTSLSGITSRDAKFVGVCNNGKIVESVDGTNWTLQTSPVTVNLTRIKKAGTAYFILGTTGNYLVSYDCTNWISKNIGSSANLSDIVSNGDNTLQTIIGSAGNIWTSVNFAESGTISARTSNTALDLTAIVFNPNGINNKYIILGANGVNLYSVDSITWKVNTVTIGGLVSNGTLNVIYGAGGLVMTSTDLKTWTVRNSGVTADLTSGTFGNGKFVIGGLNGQIIQSTDGSTWTSASFGVSVTVNSIIYDGTQFVAVGYNAIRKSTDGATWTSAYSTATSIEFASIKKLGSSYVITGSSGTLWTSTDLVAYTVRSSGATVTLRDSAEGNGVFVVVGDDGIVIYSTDLATWRAAITPLTTSVFGITYFSGVFVAVGSNGKIINSTTGAQFIEATSNTTSNLKKITVIGSKAFAIGLDFTVSTSDNGIIWTSLLEKPSNSITSLVFNGTTYTAATLNKCYQSLDGIVWTIQDLKFTGFDKVALVNGKYFLFATFAIPLIAETFHSSTDGLTWTQYDYSNTYNAIAYGKVNNSDVWVFVGDSGSVSIVNSIGGINLSFTQVSIDNSIVATKIVNTLAGSINDSNLVSLSVLGKATDSTFNNLEGNLTAGISRCNLYTKKSIGVYNNISIVDSYIKNIDSNKVDVFAIATEVTGLTLNNCEIEANGSTLLYSTNTNLAININGGVLHGGNEQALTNGFAKIFISNVFNELDEKITNISAYSLDGDTLSGLVEHTTADVISSDITHWYHAQKANLSIAMNNIVVNSPIVLSSNVDSTSSLRYKWGNVALRFLKNFGGRIKTQVTFPVGADKIAQAKTKIKAKLYIPTYTAKTYDYDTLKNTAIQNNPFLVGKTVSMGSSVDAATLINYTNIWSGRQDMLPAFYQGGAHNAYNLNRWGDSYGDVTFAPVNSGGAYDTSWVFGHPINAGSFGDPSPNSDNITQEAYVVLTGDEDVILPAGTTIRVSLILDLPKDLDIFKKFYNEDNDYTIDPHMGIENVYIHYKGISDNTFKVAIVKVAGSATRDESKYLSLTGKSEYDDITHTTTFYEVNDSYEWLDVYGLTHKQHLEPTETLAYTQDLIQFDIEIKVVNLNPQPGAAKTIGAAGSASNGIANLTVQTANNDFNPHPVSNIHFGHTLDHHWRSKGVADYTMYDKVITYQYYNPKPD